MSVDRLIVTTQSPEETEALGRALAGLLPPGAVLALRGELASGKTCLVRGIVSALTGGDPVSSPTFTLVNEYPGETPVYHMDLYRIARLEELVDLGYEELFDLDEGVCAVEWAERAEPLLPRTRLDILLEHAGEYTRTLTFQNRNLLRQTWQQHLTEAKR